MKAATNMIVAAVNIKKGIYPWETPNETPPPPTLNTQNEVKYWWVLNNICSNTGISVTGQLIKSGFTYRADTVNAALVAYVCECVQPFNLKAFADSWKV